ncbi:peptidase M15 [Acinetobacter sp. S40]|uniref:YcbK family protein n=1 Tax=unclassified Acinetobacter TaxID=196816 RepID=UPI00190E5800|nr:MULTISPECIES: D-Ala-D-Ala carboxypeptidase family metallohydrolase [unclassified Acinetobacter]MBJ9985237.1 peptidase M15 [Acinetobacter sp. S40]MBK0063276.1 peptidase M15 [Acinetobacter sp. S55]MBK0066812.1 peptidase M15 [Acinetobacter sp. S54]
MILAKYLSWLSVLILGLTACTQQSPQLSSPKKPLPIPAEAQKTHKRTPVSYFVWIAHPHNAERVKNYKNFLQQQGVQLVVPDFEFLRSARGWQDCNYEQYDVPEQSVWANIVPTLNLLSTLIKSDVLQNFELTSSYRSPVLNSCVNGAKTSSHMQNAAIDFRIGSENPDTNEALEITNSKLKLCKFWQTEGQKYNMGLGVYSTGQIHIDTKGFRTWGPDLTWHSSICAEKIP